MAEESSEKQHSASTKRIADLRKKGQVLRSRDLTSGLIFIVTVIMLIYTSSGFLIRFKKNFVEVFTSMNQVIDHTDFSAYFLYKLAIDNFLLLIPILALIFIVTVISPFIFGGWNFTLYSVRFQFEKLNPLNYFQNLFSKRMFFEVLRSMLKFIVLFSALLLFIFNKVHDIENLIYLPMEESVNSSFGIIEKFIVLIAITLVLLIIFDVIYHYFEYQNRIKMTTQELKEEHKESEGNPEVKRKLRSSQIALLKQRLSTTVPQATVIVTNPTHYAIALRYDHFKDPAPKVLAKGKDHIAHQIRTLAIANGIPIYQAPPLARAIYHTANIGSEIHPELYMAVAIVLSYVQQLKNYQQGIGQVPNFVTDLKIPNEFIYEE